MTSTLTQLLHITLPRSALAQAVATAKSATDAKSTMPILGNVLVQARDGKVVVAATDLIKTERRILPTDGIDIRSEGEITIPAKALHQILSTFTDETVTLAVEKTESGDGLRVSLRAGRSRLTLPAIAAKDFPRLPVISHKATPKTDPLLRPLLSLCVPFASTDETRTALNGVSIRDGVMGASDGHSAIMVQYRGAVGECMVPIPFVGMIPGGGEVEFLCESEHLFLRDAQGVASVQLKTPGGSDAIASLVSLYMGRDLPGYTWIKVDAAALSTHVDLCQIVDGESKTPSCSFLVGDGGKTLTVKNESYEGSVDVTGGAEDLATHKFMHGGKVHGRIGASCKNVLRALRALEGRDMEMGLPGGATDAIVFRVQSEIEGKTVVSLLVVVMPLSPGV